MIRFLDGPAAGHTLMLQSAPDFLRVTFMAGRKVGSKAHEWDALDQPLDRPEPGETIYVYRRVSRVASVHLNMGSTRRGSGFYAVADYAHVAVDGERFLNQVEWSRFVREEPFEEPTADPGGDMTDRVRAADAEHIW